MSAEHPIIAVTGSSGAGTSTVKVAFEHIFNRMGITPAIVEGDSFHAYDREEMEEAVHRATIRGENFSHFGPAANRFDMLEELFRNYSEAGTGQRRRYLHNEEEAAPFAQPAGTFTAWEPLPENTDLLFYEGLHGGLVTERFNVARHVDLLVGVVPTINLEWIQKIHRDTSERGHSPETVTRTILRRMHDYVHYIVPQFSRTDINFQRIPTVDTSNPFIARDIPLQDESFVVIRFTDPRKFRVDFPYLLNMLQGSFMSRRNTIVVPGGKMGFAMEIIFMPIIEDMLANRRRRLTRTRHGDH
ncbi:MAG TPA: phosphoribulokinase [Gammaproteobacteria bacterium]|nr:phosphoribulokinase [Gammaproteobacteria bacterium]